LLGVEINRGLSFPRVAVVDGHLGIWAACGKIHPTGEERGVLNHTNTRLKVLVFVAPNP